MENIEKNNDLKCKNMLRLNDDLKTIICVITSKKCVCISCINKKVGYKASVWCVDCPAFRLE